MKRTGGRAAFTLVELLVVIAIIGVLVALLLPAIQAAREAARRSQCKSNLKQIALAILNYESTKGRFPAGNTTVGTGITDRQSSTWSVDILPQLEQQAVYSLWDPKVDFSVDTSPGGVRNKKMRETLMPIYSCPSDIDLTQLVRPESGQGMNVDWAPGSYRGMAGTRYVRGLNLGSSGEHFWDNPQVNQAGFDSENGGLPSYTRGPLHAVLVPTNNTANLRKLPPVNLKTITDGTSNTLLVGEYHTATRPPASCPFTGAELTTSRRTMWAYAYTSYNLSCTSNNSLYLLPDYAKAWCGPPASDHSAKRAWGSLHAANIINFVRCDGSGTDISPEIDLPLFCAMGTIAAEDPR
jgi:prepilin-type N-terminal cleavage/methylation domain-containing protein